MSSIVHSFFESLVFLLALLFGYSLLLRKEHRLTIVWIRSFASGLLFGFFCLISMSVPWRIAEGVIIEHRAPLILVSGLAGGPLSAITTAIVASLFRLHLGGDGTWPGIYANLSLAAFSSVISMRYRIGRKNTGLRAVAILALSSPLLTLPWTLALPNVSEALAILKRIAPFLVVSNPVGTLVLGSLLLRERRFFELTHALLESDLRFRRLFESDAIGICVSNAKGLIVEANDAFLDLIGYRRPELPLSWRSITAPDSQLPSQRALDSIDQQNFFSPFEKEYLHKDGQQVPVLLGGVSIDNDHQQILCFAVDIRERKRLESELVQARIKAESANKAKDEFLGVISHEMRTPLNPIMGFANLLTQRAASQEEREMLGHIVSAGTRLERIISDILEFVRYSEGQMEVRNAVFSLPDLADELLAQFESNENGNQLTVTVDQPESEPDKILADRDRIMQIAINLVGNAQKFTRDGKAQIRLHTYKTESGSAELLIEVTDNGIGIPQEMLERIWEPFYQVDLSDRRQFAGIGLGLSICKRIAGAMSGSIEVQSVEGKGSTFSVRIPLQPLS